MEREIDLKEISDGKRYTAGDLVKAGCNECAGCSDCCRGMGSSIILDPYDIWQMSKGLRSDFQTLLTDKIELNIVDGVIQPNLKMQEENDACAFLNENGRCSIHSYRPGFCRMFPLGRIYEGEGFSYFLQVHECHFPNKTKVKLKKWLGIPQLSQYEEYIKSWHRLLKEAQSIVRGTENEDIIKKLNLYLLNQFYSKPYQTDELYEGATSFYELFYERLQNAEEIIKIYK